MQLHINSSDQFLKPQAQTRIERVFAFCIGSIRHHLACIAHQQTPLLSLATLARCIGLGGILVKDEGQRSALKSFKALGGAHAVVKLVLSEASRNLGRYLGPENIDSDEVADIAASLTITCATNGNHGRSVAAATRLGCRSFIFIHKGVSESPTQAEMHQHQLDALLVTSPPNFRYFTGFDSQFWESPTRPWFFIIPADGKCLAIVLQIGTPLLKGSWIAETRSWSAPRPADDGISLLAEALQKLPHRYGRIEMELGGESAVRMPLNDLFVLKTTLTTTGLVDGSPCIWNIRAIKSAAEVKYIKQSCTIASDAFAKLPSPARCDQTEREIAQALLS